MSIGLQVTPPFVTISSDDPVTRFAAAEWVRYAVAAGGPPLTAVGLEPGLLATPAHDSLRLVAATPRELLQAVYGGLEERGWRWFLPGPLGEAFLPGTPSPRGTRPGFAARLLVDRSSLHDAALWRTEALHIIEWMSRNQLTTLAIENEDLQPEAIGWLIDELARRGLALEVGGDIVPHLLAQTRADEPPPVRHRRGRHHARRLEVADPAALAALPAPTNSRSASGITMMALLPPSSRRTRPNRSATTAPTRLPMRQEPVAEMSGRRRSATMVSPTSASVPMTSPKRSAGSSPLGRKSSCSAITVRARSLVAIATSGVSRLGFHTQALPQTAAIIAFHAHTAAGKLKAVMMPIVPKGCHCSYIRWLGRSECIDSP